MPRGRIVKAEVFRGPFDPGGQSEAGFDNVPEGTAGSSQAPVPDGNEGPGGRSPRALGPIGGIYGVRGTPRGHE